MVTREQAGSLVQFVDVHPVSAGSRDTRSEISHEQLRKKAFHINISTAHDSREVNIRQHHYSGIVLSCERVRVQLRAQGVNPHLIAHT